MLFILWIISVLLTCAGCQPVRRETCRNPPVTLQCNQCLTLFEIERVRERESLYLPTTNEACLEILMIVVAVNVRNSHLNHHSHYWQ